MADDSRFAEVTAKCTVVDLPVEQIQVARFIIEGSGKRRWVRMINEDGSIYSIEVMDGIIEVFVEGSAVIRSSTLDDLEWCTEYCAAKLQLKRARLWAYSTSSEEVLAEFASGPSYPVGRHHRRMWAREFSGAEWVRIWLSAFELE